MRLIIGIQPVREAIRSEERGRKPPAKILVDDRGSPQLDALARFAHDRGIPVERVSRADIDWHTRGAHHQGVAAIAPELPIVTLEELTLGPRALALALDELQDPQNFGAVLRSAVALGTTAVLWPEHSSAPLSPATFRASAGAVEHATLCRVQSLPTALEELAARGLDVVGLDAHGDELLQEATLELPLVLVVGAEGKGLRKPVKQACRRLVRLPMKPGAVDSLNASVAAAIALYEITRRHGI
ncbi:23S rRNA (guanosine(2251)-2'-O)-methyltransferase RlmB [Pendulispora albinea]|uniref:23S rRNA (Guanosine(2251)-2'-O)-methyltransferase RlmB n=1 Tax=Pendulispora albinea TaxID=2741071 RepID=A0ABZ2M9R4_9BACT